jgi:hypothetical protein
MPSLNTGNAILSNAIAVDSSYNVGIGGAASGSFKLQVTGTSNLTGALTGTSGVFSSSLTATAFIPTSSTIPTNGLYLPAANTLGFSTNSSLDMVITATGNVGIGTSSPTDFGSTYTTLCIDNATNGGVLDLRRNGVRGLTIAVDNSEPRIEARVSGQPLVFYTNNGGTVAPRLTIASTGAATFSSNVSVNGNTVANGTLSITKNSTFNIEGSAAIAINSTNSANNTELLIGTDGTNNIGYIQTAEQGVSYSSKSLSLQPNGGNVGIGTSSVNSWASNYVGINIGNGFGIMASRNSYDGYIASNTYYNGSDWIVNNSASVKPSVIQNYNGFAFLLGNTNSVGSATSLVNAMTITSGGQVGINTIDGGVQLSVKSTTTTSASYPLFLFNSAGTGLFYVRSDGLIQTGTAAASPYNNTTGGSGNVLVDSGGNLYRATSSLKYKKNVQDYTKGLVEVLQLRPVTYEGKSEADKGKIFGGLIAEEVHELGLTEFVVYAEDGTPDALAYSNMVALAFKAIQELKAEIDELKQIVATK